MGPVLSRRAMLQAMGAAAIGVGLESCAIKAPAGAANQRQRRKRLAPVVVGQERVVRTVAGLRPFRPGGFVLRSERLAGRTIVHNYGHGGGGVTLSWGTGRMAVDLVVAAGEKRVAVLGAGAVGLASAWLLLRHGFQVTVYAKDFPPETTSDKAGAQWTPSWVYDHEAVTPEFRTQFDTACHLSFRAFQHFLGPTYGVRWIDNYQLAEEPFPDRGYFGSQSPIRDLYPDVHDLPSRLSPFDAPYVRRFPTMLIEPPVYLEALMRDIVLFGGKGVEQAFDRVDDLLGLPETVIVNCTGLGAGKLFGDEQLIPMRGQLAVLLPQPEVDYIALAGDYYMFPRADGILLGGTYERGVWDDTPEPATIARLVETHQRLFARVKR